MLGQQDLIDTMPEKSTLRRQFSASTTDEDFLLEGPKVGRQFSVSTDEDFLTEGSKQRWADLSEEDDDAFPLEKSSFGPSLDLASTSDEDLPTECPNQHCADLPAEEGFTLEPNCSGLAHAAAEAGLQNRILEHTDETSVLSGGNLLHEQWGDVAYDSRRVWHADDWRAPLAGNNACEEWGGIAFDRWCELFWAECAEEQNATHVGNEVYEDWGGIAYDRWFKNIEHDRADCVRNEHAVSIYHQEDEHSQAAGWFKGAYYVYATPPSFA